MKITYFRHAFFKISSYGFNILIDPFVSCKSEKKLTELVRCPNIDKHINGIDLILLTHEHFDHFDKEFVEKVARKNMCFVVGNEDLLKELNLPSSILKPAKSFSNLNIKDVFIECFPSHHPTSFYPLSYLIRIKDESVFHAGDTDLMDYFAKIRANVALLPIGGSYTMDVVDAVRATKMIKPDFVIPMHYNTWDDIKADPNEFKIKIEKSILKTEPIILKPGQTLDTSKAKGKRI
ncbi:MAG: metal-dependent hydrolase [Candidatus Diapherotrites archaeon]|nr:metal-dependent hydrolase [Candidatus Diapherotrites archaeon]